MGAGISLIGRHKASAFLLTLHHCYQFRKQCLWVRRTLASDHSYCASTSLMSLNTLDGDISLSPFVQCSLGGYQLVTLSSVLLAALQCVLLFAEQAGAEVVETACLIELVDLKVSLRHDDLVARMSRFSQARCGNCGLSSCLAIRFSACIPLSDAHLSKYTKSMLYLSSSLFLSV
jgi:hypothetical protein